MKLVSQSQLSSWLPSIHPQVWILAIGRFFSEVGTGFTLFYAPIFFVNEVGLSATAVGIALASASISGIVGRVVGGSLADSLEWGRRRTLLLATAILAIASLVFAATNNFTILVIASLIHGLGIGFYWPGVYFSINALCWAVGSFIGHPLGGWALDQSRIIADRFWLGFSLSVAIAVAILQYLNQILADSSSK